MFGRNRGPKMRCFMIAYRPISSSTSRQLIPTVFVIGFLAVGSAAAQTKPTDEVVMKAIRGVVGVDPDAAVAIIAHDGVAFGSVDVKVQAVEVSRFGSYNSQGRYWPVEVCIRGITHTPVLGPSGDKQVNARVRYRFKIDDFGAWSFDELKPDRNVSVASLICGPGLSTSSTAPATAATAPERAAVAPRSAVPFVDTKEPGLYFSVSRCNACRYRGWQNELIAALTSNSEPEQ